MKTEHASKSAAAAFLAIACIALAAPAGAATIGYTVGGWSGQFPSLVPVPDDAPNGVNGYPGDTVTLEGYAGTLDLTPGVQVLKVNTLAWNIDYTYGGDSEATWTNPSFLFASLRNIQIGAANAGLSQQGHLDTTYYVDTLSLDDGTSVTLFSGGYKIQIRALGLLGVTSGDGGAQPTRDVNAEFTLTSVPEPSTWAMMLIGFAGAGIAVRSRRRELSA